MISVLCLPTGKARQQPSPANSHAEDDGPNV
eukprot:CAMPEP_0169402366 /NCGR_PEP_ID=MMETSP1017-20121227/55101_1 /TAXON_ID=342587 /ORGANISM="Karlodinium micrum, Strain CCMP2283" /LENGTH=30 /DNA_ID= /DNA_START= /DNA_END= /DNA_ORIENTATION=